MDEKEARENRAKALAHAAQCWRGDVADVEGILALADEFLQYIEGNNAVMPRPDKAIKGRIPR